MRTPTAGPSGLAEIFFGPFANLFRQRRANRVPGRRITFERLEPRILPSADLIGVEAPPAVDLEAFSFDASITVEAVNHAPVLAGNATFPSVAEDTVDPVGTPIATFLVANPVVVADQDIGDLLGVAVTGVDDTNGAWQFSLDAGTSWDDFGAATSTNARLLDASAQMRFLPDEDFSGLATFAFRAWDQTAGVSGGLANTSINGGTSAYSSGVGTAVLAVTPMNDAPVRTAGAPAPVVVNEDSANVTAVSLGLGGLAYAPGPADEAGQTLTYTLIAIPGFIKVFLADGTTQVVAGNVLSDIDALRGLTYKTVAHANGSFPLVWWVTDSGPGTPPDANRLAESLSITVNAVVNDAPVRTAGAPAPVVVNEDSANVTAVSLGLGGLAYAPGPADEAGQTLTYTLIAIPGFIKVFLADGTTQVVAGNVLSDIDALRGLTYKTVAHANGSFPLVWWVTDSGPGTPPDANRLAESLSITVNAVVNDAPVRTAGAPAPVVVNEDSANVTAVSLGLGGLAYAPGPADEAGQTLTYTLIAIPGFIKVFLADGTTQVVAGNVLSDIDALRGLTYKTVAHANGSFPLVWWVTDSGPGTPPDANRLAESLSITVNAVDDAPAIVYIDDDFTGGAGTPITDADPVTAGNQAAVVGVNAFATIQAGVNAVAQGGTVKVNSHGSNAAPTGAYAESVSITKALTLDGSAISGLATHVVIDPVAGNGITVSGVNADNVTIRDLRVTGGVDGISASGVGNVTITNVRADGNSDDGIQLVTVGAIVFSNVTATGNDPGVLVSGAASFSDTDGIFTGNDNHGIQLIDIAGNVTLTRTVADNNDANDDNVGDGLNATASANVAAIGGNLLIQGARFRDSGGVNDHQERGVFIQSVAGTSTITFNNSTGVVQSNIVSGNERDGVLIADGGSTATFVNGSYSSNGGDGISLGAVGGAVVLTSVTASSNLDAGVSVNGAASFSDSDGVHSGNVNHGIQLIDIAGLVSLTRVTANDNDANNGTIGDGVNMIDSAADVDTNAIGSLLVVGGSFSDTAAAGGQRFGIRVGNGIGPVVHSVATSVDFQSDTVAGALQHVSITGNQESGVEIEDGGTTASVSGTYSNNLGAGFSIASLSGGFTVSSGAFSANGSHGLSLIDVDGAVTLSGVTADDNGGNGLNAVDGSDGGTLAVGGLTVSGSSFNDTAAGNAQGVGVLVGDVGGDVVFNDAGASGNGAGGVDIAAVSGSVTFASVTGASYSNNGGDGVNVASLTGTLTVSGISASGNVGQGLAIGAGSTAASIGNSTFNGNTLGDGISLGAVGGAVVLTSVTASSNLDAGVSVNGAASFSDSDGVHSGNVNHGIQLIDIAGLVSLTRVTANDNDANNGTIGDGVNMIDSAADVDTNAIGSLLVVGGSFSDTAAAGGQRFGIRVGNGIGPVVHSVATSVDFQSDTVAGALQHVSITGNQESGVEIEDGGTTASVSGTYSNNLGAGFSIASLSGGFTVSSGAFSANGSHGLSLIDVDGAVTLSGVTADDNGGNGLNAVDGSDGGTLAVGGLTVSGSSFNDTAAGNAQGVGVLVGDVGGDVVFNDAGASGNGAGGVDIAAVSGSVTFASVTGASYSNNGGDGVNVASLTGTLTVSGISASGNVGQGLAIGAGSTAASIGNSTFNGNTLGDGISLGAVGGAVVLTSVTASSNLDAGVSVNGAASFSDSDGVHSGNVNHGIQLIDIAGLVSLTRVTANDNDANNGTIGDGVNMIDSAADVDTNAIGSLLVVGGSFSDTAAAGGQRFGIRVGNGIGPVVHSVATSVDFQSDTVAGALQHVSITGNQESGVEIEDGGTSATFTNGTYSGNSGDGINIASLSGALTVAGVAASNNGDEGIEASGTGLIHLGDVNAVNNGGDAINLSTSDTITIVGTLDVGVDNVVLTAAGGVAVEGGAVLRVDLAGTAAGQYTTFTISGAVTLDGTLEAELVSGFVPTDGDRFPFMTFGSRSGFFATTILPADFIVDQSAATALVLEFAPNDAPVFTQIGPQSVEEGRTLRFTVSATDEDDPAATLTFATVGALPAGASFNATTHEFVWTPPDDASTSVTFIVTDPHNATDTMVVLLTATNAAPTVNAGADQVVGLQDFDDGHKHEHENTQGQGHHKGDGEPEANVSIAALFGDLGVGDTHTATINWGDGSTPTAGTITEPTATADGVVKGEHTYAEAGRYTVTVTVRDDDGAVRSDTLVITVTNPLEKKNFEARKDSYRLDEDTVLRVTAANGVLANDRAAAGATLQARVVEGPEHGNLVFNADGSFTYTPDAHFDGKDSFWYEFTDGTNVSKAVEVGLDVKNVPGPHINWNGTWS